jgi:predicted nuclease with TOPRIM domain
MDLNQSEAKGQTSETTETKGQEQLVTKEFDSTKDAAGVFKKNQELLSKLKELQTKASEAQSRLDEIEQTKLMETGQKDEVIKRLQTQIKEREDKLKVTTQSFALKIINAQVADQARAMGCDKPEILLKLADLSTVSVMDDFSVDSDALKAAIERVKVDLPELFKKQVAAPRDEVPASAKGFNFLNADSKPATKEDIIRKLKELG